MTTFKSVKIFVENGIAYFGIPEDMIMYFLDQALKGKENEKFQTGKEMLTKLELVAATQADLDEMMASKIESTVIEQIVESERLLAQRAQWVAHTVRFDKSMNVYRYNNDNIEDLNNKLKLKLRLAWVYKMFALKYAGVAMGFMEDWRGVKKSGSKKRQVTCIDIPRPVVEKILSFVSSVDKAIPPERPAPPPGPPSKTIQELLADVLKPRDAKPPEPVKEPEAVKEPEPQKDTLIEAQLSNEDQEIAEFVLAFIERDGVADLPFLKAKVERALAKSIDWSVFSRVVENLTLVKLISVEGTMVKKPVGLKQL